MLTSDILPLIREAARYADRKTVVLICGGNPSPAIRWGDRQIIGF